MLPSNDAQHRSQSKFDVRRSKKGQLRDGLSTFVETQLKSSLEIFYPTYRKGRGEGIKEIGLFWKMKESSRVKRLEI